MTPKRRKRKGKWPLPWSVDKNKRKSSCTAVDRGQCDRRIIENSVNKNKIKRKTLRHDTYRDPVGVLLANFLAFSLPLFENVVLFVLELHVFDERQKQRRSKQRRHKHKQYEVLDNTGERERSRNINVQT